VVPFQILSQWDGMAIRKLFYKRLFAHMLQIDIIIVNMFNMIPPKNQSLFFWEILISLDQGLE
jgi:hypothetical protein